MGHRRLIKLMIPNELKKQKEERYAFDLHAETMLRLSS
jgi:hypothetical protein